MRREGVDSLSEEVNLPARRFEKPGEQIEKGRLTRSVGPYDRVDFAFNNRQTDLIGGPKSLEFLDQMPGFQGNR